MMRNPPSSGEIASVHAYDALDRIRALEARVTKVEAKMDAQDAPREILDLLDMTLKELLDVAEGRKPLPVRVQQTIARRAYHELRLFEGLRGGERGESQ